VKKVRGKNKPSTKLIENNASSKAIDGKKQKRVKLREKKPQFLSRVA